MSELYTIMSIKWCLINNKTDDLMQCMLMC